MSNYRLDRLESAAEKTARMLAGQHGIRVVIGHTAQFNTDTRVLEMPAYEHLPVDSADAWRGILDHEVAHAVHTDGDVVKTGLSPFNGQTRVRVHKLWNAFEDRMIERRWVIEYPGSVRHFAVRNAWVDNWLGPMSATTDPGYVGPNGTQPIGPFSALIQALCRMPDDGDTSGVHPATAALLGDPAVAAAVADGFRATNSTEAVTAAVALWHALNDLSEQEPKEPESAPDSKGTGLGGGTAASTGDGIGGGVGGSGGGGVGAAGGEEYDRVALAKRAADGPVVDLTEEARRAMIANVMATATRRALRYDVHPAARARDEWHEHELKAADMFGIDRKIADYAERYGRRLANRLAAAILTASRSLPVPSEESGVIDSNALVDVAIRSPRRDVFVDRTSAISRRTHVAVLVDCSGSMSNGPEHGSSGWKPCARWEHAAAAAWTLHKALKLARVSHAVYGHSTGYTGGGTAIQNSTHIDGDLLWTRARYTLRMHTFIQAPGYNNNGCGLSSIRPDSGNLDGEAVLAVAKRTLDVAQDCDRVILIVISDGLPAGADDSVKDDPALVDAVSRVAAAGIEVYGLGIGTHSTQYSDFYPIRPGGGGRAATGHVVLDTAEGLTDTLCDSLAHLLAGGRGARRKS